jgi:hypothetical protein
MAYSRLGLFARASTPTAASVAGEPAPRLAFWHDGAVGEAQKVVEPHFVVHFDIQAEATMRADKAVTADRDIS